MNRKNTKKIYIGDVPVGGGSQVTVQSMTNTDTKDIDATVKQILEFEKVGCHLSRSAINSIDDAKAIPEIKSKTHIPFIADIQYSADLAIAAVENGADCLRINPGNIGGTEEVERVVQTCKKHNTPIRIGVNGGSIHQKYLDKFGGVNSESLVHSCLDEIRLVESFGFDQIKLSIKASNVALTIEVYEKISKLVDYPLHVGITEAGSGMEGIIKSSVGIGSILSRGIGDTIRVSLTEDPVKEIPVARNILKSIGLLQEGIDFISCPTCARTKINLISVVENAKKHLKNIDKNITVAIMGCPVNGPGEAREADIGIAAANKKGILFKKGEIIKTVDEKDLLNALVEEIEKM